MAMTADFLDAHRRHLDDAEQLFAARRWANADHLYGLAAECGLKRLARAFGMPYDDGGSPKEKKDRVHANAIWDRFESYRAGHHFGVAYAIPMPNPFGNWDVSQRYAHHANFDESHAQSHQVGAQAVCALIKKAQREGLI